MFQVILESPQNIFIIFSENMRQGNDPLKIQTPRRYRQAISKKFLRTGYRFVELSPSSEVSAGNPFCEDAAGASNGGAPFRIFLGVHLRASTFSKFGIDGFPFSVAAEARICIKGVT